jgi:hypothetical protein
VAILFIAMKKRQTIFRVVNQTNFTQLPNEMLQDKNLSMAALGVISFILSNSKEWTVNRDFIKKRFPHDPANKIKTVFRDLEALGYAQYSVESEGREIFQPYWTFYSFPIPMEERSNRTCWKSADLSYLDFSCSKEFDHDLSCSKNLEHITIRIANNKRDNKIEESPEDIEFRRIYELMGHHR